MHPLNFTSFDWTPAGELTGTYAPWLVALSVGIAILAAYVGFSQIEFSRTSGRATVGHLWRIVGAVALGVGVWTMHFIGMLAFELPVPVAYRLDGTIISAVPAMVTAYVTLLILDRETLSRWMIVLGGVVMGVGICAMHYIGMAAMVAPMTMLYRPIVFAGSIHVAMVAATLALAAHAHLRQSALRPWHVAAISAVLMGLTISSMHYLGMAAAVYLPEFHDVDVVSPILSGGALGITVTLAAIGVLTVAMVSIELSQRVEQAAREAAQSQQKVRELDKQLRSIASRLPGMIYRFTKRPDGSYAFPFASAAMRDIYGYDPEDLLDDASPAFEAIHPDDLPAVQDSINRSAETGEAWQQRYRVQLRDGRLLWLFGNAMPRFEEDGTIHWDGFIMDVSSEMRAEETIRRLAYTDSLTGLPNRTTFTAKLRDRLMKGERGAVLFLDLDRFKVVNDLRGHTAGDELLKAVALNLKMAVREQDLVARIGGDEFVVAVAQTEGSEPGAIAALQVLASRLLTAAARAASTVHGSRLARSASIGVCLYRPGDGLDEGEILKRADIAMYRAKDAGGNTIRFFDAEMGRTMEARYLLEQELVGAVERNELAVYLQRQVDAEGTLVGAEALLRWLHPRMGMISPATFIPMAEETGQIVALGDWVLQSVCETLRTWQQDPFLSSVPIAVNVSPRQFFDEDFIERVVRTVDAAGIDPSLVKLEITESLIMEDLDDARGRVQALQDRGIRLSIDDFGTGYSSLSYLANLAFDELKIDRSFTQRLCLPDREREHLVVDMIIELGHRLGIQVCAEGVETVEQLAELKRCGCDCYQGFYFEKPVPVSAFCTDRVGEVASIAS